MNRRAASHGVLLTGLGIDRASAGPLAAYLDLLAAWSARVNLTAARTAEERVRLLVAPVLPAVPHVAPGTLIDVGSGNGSPGLVLALLRRDLRVTLLEPRTKRWAFLREAARAAGRADVDVVRARHDAYSGPPAATVCVRALALPPHALEALVAPGGRLLVFGPPPATAADWEAETPAGGLHVLRRRST